MGNYQLPMCGIRRLAMGLVVVLMAGCNEPTQPVKEASAPAAPATMAQAIRQTLREPTPGQFPTPESAVRFYLECVRDRDPDEAMRVFPLRQQMDLTTEQHALEFRGIRLSQSPLPNADLYNVVRQLDFFSRDFVRLSYLLLSVDTSSLMELNDPGMPHDPEEAARAIAAKLDMAPLRHLRFGEISVEREVDVEKMLTGRWYGATRQAYMFTHVELEGRQMGFDFFAIKVGDNWLLQRFAPASWPAGRPPAF